MPKPVVSIVIVHHNTPDDLQYCLETLGHQFDFEILVVDSASSQSIRSIAKKFPYVKVHELPWNCGFSFACNYGLSRANGNWVLFLNPDMAIEPLAIDKMVRYAQQKQLDAVSPQLNDFRYRQPLPSLIWMVRQFTPIGPLIPSFLAPQTLVGGCLLIRQAVIKHLGGWDEKFWLWFEDSDLTYRLKKAGYKYGFIQVPVNHTGGASVSLMSKQAQRQIFFHSLSIYAQTHLSPFSQLLAGILRYKFAGLHHLLPIKNRGLSVVIPNMRYDLLIDFLDSNISSFPLETQIICVSSGLNSQRIWQLRRKYPLVRFISLIHNHGFSSTVNIGFRTATTPIVATINDDVILNSASLAKLINSPANYGSLNPVIYKLDHSIESAGIEILTKGKAQPLQDLPIRQRAKVDAANGACVFYTHEALDKVGLFAESFGSYLEDIELSLRLNEHGLGNYVLKDTAVIHVGHQSSKRFWRYKKWQDFKNWILIILWHWELSTLVSHLPMIILERIKNFWGILKSD